MSSFRTCRSRAVRAVACLAQVDRRTALLACTTIATSTAVPSVHAAKGLESDEWELVRSSIQKYLRVDIVIR